MSAVGSRGVGAGVVEGAAPATRADTAASARRPLPWRGAVIPGLLLLAAEASMRLHPVQSDALAAPSQVLAALARALADGSLLFATWQTLLATLGGLAVGTAIGVPIGIGFGLSRNAAARGALTLELLKPIPSVALIPIAMMVFGYGYRLEMSVVAFTTLFPMLILTQGAVRAVPARLLEVGAVLGLSTWQTVAKIVLPSALPRVFVATRLGIGIALVVAVTAEVVANPQGLGYALMAAQQSLAPDLMLANLLWVGLLGWGLSAGLLALQRRWFEQSLAGASA